MTMGSSARAIPSQDGPEPELSVAVSTAAQTALAASEQPTPLIPSGVLASASPVASSLAGEIPDAGHAPLASNSTPPSEVSVASTLVEPVPTHREVPPIPSTSATPSDESRCTSGVFFYEHDEEDDEMAPGQKCVDCHANEAEAPDFSFAGTVFPTLHEPDNCRGLNDPNIRIIITDAKGERVEVRINPAGNFHYEAELKLPYRVKLISAMGEFEMKDPAISGDCNLCHTEKGSNKAFGRLVPFKPGP